MLFSKRYRAFIGNDTQLWQQSWLHIHHVRERRTATRAQISPSCSPVRGGCRTFHDLVKLGAAAIWSASHLLPYMLSGLYIKLCHRAIRTAVDIWPTLFCVIYWTITGPWFSSHRDNMWTHRGASFRPSSQHTYITNTICCVIELNNETASSCQLILLTMTWQQLTLSIYH